MNLPEDRICSVCRRAYVSVVPNQDTCTSCLIHPERDDDEGTALNTGTVQINNGMGRLKEQAAIGFRSARRAKIRSYSVKACCECGVVFVPRAPANKRCPDCSKKLQGYRYVRDCPLSERETVKASE